MMKNNKLNINIRHLFYNKTFTVTFSIICAFVIWLVIMINQNPIREQSFTGITPSINVENTTVSDLGLGIVSDISKQRFTVTVSGPNYIVSSLKTDDFTLTVDIGSVTAPGTYNLSVLGVRNSNKTGYTFASISPSTIDITFDYIDSKEFVLVPKLIGVSAVEGLIAETPVIANSEQSSITIKGPRAVMEKIASVGTVAEVNKTLSSSQSYDSDIVLYDKSGDVLYRYSNDGHIYDKSDKQVLNNNLSLEFTSVKVTQPISKKKSVNVIPVFENLPAGISADSLDVSVDHQTVTVIGTPDVVDSMTSLSLTAIDFRNLSLSNDTFEISPNLPEGVKLLDNIDFFTVRVNTVNYAEKTFTVTDIRFTGVGSGLSARKNSSIRNVKICGDKSVIESLTTADLFAVVDLKEKQAGNYTVDAVIKSSKYDKIWAVGTYTASVTIK